MPAPVFPAAFSPTSEPNAFLKRHKASLQRRWSLTRMKELFEEVDLGFYLHALHRPSEAVEVVSFLASSVPFSGDYNVWTPAGYALALQARLGRQSGDTQATDDALTRLRLHPSLAYSQQDTVRSICDAPDRLRDAFEDKSQKWSCHRLSRTLEFLCYYRETAVAGFPHQDWYPVDDLERLMMDGLDRLSCRLQSR